MPLLPLEYIESTFKSLCKEALKLDKDQFSPFITYFHDEWMKTVTPYHFCVYMRGTRTTAVAESFNGKVNKLFKTHGSFFSFCETLQKIEASTSTKLENYINGTLQRDTRKPFYKKRAKLINILWIDYKNNPKMLLNALANPKNKALYADDEITTEIDDVELATCVELYGNADGTVYMEVQITEEIDRQFETRPRTNMNLSSSKTASSLGNSN